MDQYRKPLTPVEIQRAFAMIDKAHQLEGQQLDLETLDRARRILAQEISPEEARVELEEALEAIVESERTEDGG